MDGTFHCSKQICSSSHLTTLDGGAALVYAGKRKVLEALDGATQRVRETAHWEMVTAPLPPPEEGRVENILFLFRHWPGTSGTQTSLRAVSSVSGSQEGESCELCITGLLPSSSLASGQQWCPRSSHSAHSWNQVRAVTLESPLHIVTCGLSQASIRVPAFPPTRRGIS